MGWFVSKDRWCAHYPGLDAELMTQSKTRRRGRQFSLGATLMPQGTHQVVICDRRAAVLDTYEVTHHWRKEEVAHGWLMLNRLMIGFGNM
jgi:hypothetical protein